MGDLTRTNTPDADPFAWADTPAPKPVDPEQRRAEQEVGTDLVAHAVHQVAAGVKDLDNHLATATQALEDELDYTGLADTVAWLHDVRSRLAVLESYVSRELGRMDGCPDVITLSDGRLAEVMKGKDRKAWRHDDWKRDVRLAVSDGIGGDVWVVDPETGETHEEDATAVIHGAIAAAQAVHGSTAPKVTALKALGLSADDYCESYPGPYSVKISAPSTTD